MLTSAGRDSLEIHHLTDGVDGVLVGGAVLICDRDAGSGSVGC